MTTKIRETSFQIFLVLLGALLSFGGTWLYDWWKGKDYDSQANRIEKELVSQSDLVKQQTGILSSGFTELTTVLRSNGAQDAKVNDLLAQLNEGVSHLTKSTTDLSASAASSAQWARYFIDKLDVPAGANEILVSSSNDVAEYVDAKNQIAVLAVGSKGSNARVNFNGYTRNWNVGDKRPYKDENGKDCRITYMGVRANFCVFSNECGN